MSEPKFKVGDVFMDTAPGLHEKLGYATVIAVEKTRYTVTWEKAGLGTRDLNDPELRRLTKLEKALL